MSFNKLMNKTGVLAEVSESKILQTSKKVRQSAFKIKKRIAQEKVLLAMGLEWDVIARELELSESQLKYDKIKIDSETTEQLEGEGIYNAFADFRTVSMMSIMEIQQIIDSEGSSASLKLNAIREKLEVMTRVLDKGIEVGIWRKADEEFSMEDPKRLRNTRNSTPENIIEQLTRA